MNTDGDGLDEPLLGEGVIDDGLDVPKPVILQVNRRSQSCADLLDTLHESDNG